MTTTARAFAAPEGLPTAPAGARLARVTFRTCPGSSLALAPVDDVDGALDAHGVARDGWWAVTCAGQPTRTLRLFRGAHSLRELLRRYGFQDAAGCVNHRDAVAHYAPAAGVALPGLPRSLPRALRDACGVPQFEPRSGVCWYATLCTATFGNADVAALVLPRLPADLRPHAARCLHDRAAARALRDALWHRLRVGDDVTLDPSHDGRNGYSEFTVLCAKLGVPMLRFREDGGRMRPLDPRVTDRAGRPVTVPRPRVGADGALEPHLLVLRYQDGDHRRRFPIHRRIYYGGRRYRLAGMYMGQRHCGHQIGVVCPTGDWRTWAIGDADLHKDGIGLVHVDFAGVDGALWWPKWNELVHVTKFGAGYADLCNFSPHNPNDDALLTGKVKARPGSNSIDVQYVPADDAARASRGAAAASPGAARARP
jgi:hypothetical protein